LALNVAEKKTEPGLIVLFYKALPFYATTILVLFIYNDWGLNSGLHACKAGGHMSSPFCSGYFWR
jgi:hypothetical protein